MEPPDAGPGAGWLPRTRRRLVGMPLTWQDSRVKSGQVCGLCLNPRTCMPVRSWDLGMGYGWELDVYCPETPLSQSIA